MTDQEVWCVSCGVPLVPGDRFCHACGKDQAATGSTLACPNCGAQNPAFAWRCARCNQQLGPSSASTSREAGGLTVSDVALGVFIGMLAYSVVGAVIWWFAVYVLMAE